MHTSPTESIPKKILRRASSVQRSSRLGIAGIPNCTAEETVILLDLAEEHTSLGQNHWALLTNFSKSALLKRNYQHATRNHCGTNLTSFSVPRSQQDLQIESRLIRRGKHISRDIQLKAAYCVLGSTVEDKRLDEVAVVGGEEVTIQMDRRVGERDDKKRASFSGLKLSGKLRKQEPRLLEHVGQMKVYIGAISQSLGFSNTVASTEAINKAD